MTILCMRALVLNYDPDIVWFSLQQKASLGDPNHLSTRHQTDGAQFVVHRQPIALDRFTIHDVRPPDTSSAGRYRVNHSAPYHVSNQVQLIQCTGAPSYHSCTDLHVTPKVHQTAPSSYIMLLRLTL